MVKIRLTRMGKRKMPFYRVVVIESSKRRDGAYIDCLGFYDPIKDPTMTKLDTDKALKWLMNGAQCSDTVSDLFTKYGVLEKFHNLKMQKAKAEEK